MKNPIQNKNFRLSFQVIFLVSSFAIFVIIYWIPPVDLIKPIKEIANGFNIDAPSEGQLNFYLEQYRVGTGEIANNNLKIDGWFYSKYIIIGGFLAALLYNFFIKHNKCDDWKEPKELISLSASKPSMCLIVSIAFVLCLSIDLQIKDRSIGGMQRGIWIKYFIEKPFSKYTITNNEGDSIEYCSNIIGWESFYHNGMLSSLIEYYPLCDSAKTLSLIDNNENNTFFISKFSPRYFLTYLIYVFFILIMFQNFKNEKHKFRDHFIIITFIIVHACIFIASYLMHTLPNTLEYTECIIGKFDGENTLNKIRHVRNQALLLSSILVIWNFIGFRLIDGYTKYEENFVGFKIKPIPNISVIQNKNMKSEAKTVEEYIENLPEDRKEAFIKLRDIIIKNLPDGFKEEMSYNMVGYVVPHSIYPDGYHCDTKLPLPFINIANQKNFLALYHMGIYANKETLDWFTSEYSKQVTTKLDMGKSCIRFKNINKIPFDLIGELCKKITVKDWIATYEKNVKN